MLFQTPCTDRAHCAAHLKPLQQSQLPSGVVLYNKGSRIFPLGRLQYSASKNGHTHSGDASLLCRIIYS